MALQKAKALLLSACLLVGLILSGCGGQPLAQREIVRGILFTRQNARYSACLVVADQGADSFQEEQIKIAAAHGKTPAQALQYAEDSLSGDAYYGLLDLLALPANSNWQEACSIGSLLYKNVQPAPEISVFALSPEPIQSWAKQGPTLYQNLKALEKTYGIHCGLQQLFTQENSSAIPGYTAESGYDFLLLGKNAASVRCKGLTGAQLAAVLCGQTKEMYGTFGEGQAVCRTRAHVTVEGNQVQLHLRDTELHALTDSVKDLENMLTRELEESFAYLYLQTQKSGTDPFHLDFWQACLYGPGSVANDPELRVIFE